MIKTNRKIKDKTDRNEDDGTFLVGNNVDTDSHEVLVLVLF